jgi:hypothetical protein
MADKQNISKDLKCEICDYSTPLRGNLKNHTNLVHLKTCSSQFGSINSDLKSHIGCDHCDNKAFGRPWKKIFLKLSKIEF